MSKKLETDWWNQPKETAHESIFGVLSFLDKNQSYVEDDNLRFAKLYGNSDIMGLTTATYSRVENVFSKSSRLTLNVVKSAIDTMVAKISKNKPRPYFLTDGGSWSMKRKAKLLTKFSDGIFYSTKMYEMGPMIFRDACVWGMGAMKIYNADGKICVDRVLPDELKFDDAESFYGEPRQMHQVKWVDRQVLKAMFPKKKNEIENAGRDGNRYGNQGGMNLADQIAVAESWHLPSSKDAKDGRHMISIDTGNLFDEVWEKDYFPFVFLRWTDKLVGFRGTGIAEDLMGIQLEINRLLKTIQLSMRLCSVPKVFVENGAKVVLEHINNEIGGIIRYTGQKPIYEAINAVPAELFAQLDRLYSRAYEIVGISQLSAQSQKPAGLDSGKALREFNDIESDRFMTVGQKYEQFFMSAIRQMIGQAQDIYERDGKFEIDAPEKKFKTRINWGQIKLDESDYVMQVFPSSSLSKTPSGRLQDVQELLQAGFISKEDGLKLLDFPDLEAVTNLLNAAAEDIDMIIEKMVEDGDYITPEPYQNLSYGIQRIQSAYLKAKMDKVPEKNLELLRRWMSEAETMINDAMTAQEPEAPALPEAPPTSDMLPMPGAGAPISA